MKKIKHFLKFMLFPAPSLSKNNFNKKATRCYYNMQFMHVAPYKKHLFSLILLLFLTGWTSASARTSIDELIFIPAKQNGNWGYINTLGKWTIPPKYEDALSFTEGLAAVKYYGKWGYINAAGDWIVQPQFTDAKEFHEGIACVLKHNKWGYINTSGSWLIKPTFIKASAFGEHKALVDQEGRYIFINDKGNQQLSLKLKDASTFSEGLAYAEYGGYKGYINPKGEWVLRHTYDRSYSFSEGMAIFYENHRYGFIDILGKKAIQPVFEDATHFSGGYAAVKYNGKWGYINGKGEIIIEYSFDYATPFHYGFATVKKEGKWGLINSEGYWVLDPSNTVLKEPHLAYTLQSMTDNMVESQIQSWRERGEFETSEAYHERVTGESNHQVASDIRSQSYTQLAGLLIPNQNIRIGRYLADYGAFMVHVPYSLPFLLPVPIEEAQKLDQSRQQENVKWDSLQFDILNNKLVVVHAIAKINGKAYTYHSKYRQQSEAQPIRDIPVSPQPFQQPGIISPAQPDNYTESDVDIDIPVYKWQQKQIFALVIGNEDYSSYQSDLNHETNVPFAENDAIVFTEYLKKTFGVPKDNIQTIINGTAGQIKQGLSKLMAISKAWEGEATLIFYYAGHGLPDPSNETPYILPVDVNANNLQYAIALEEVFDYLSRYETKRSMVFLDACFTGAGRENALLATRGVRIQPKSPFVLGNLMVFNATSGKQTALPYYEKHHGMFTYYLLKSWKESNGKINLGDLAAYLQRNVNKTSVLLNSKEQVPNVKVSPIFENTWKASTMYLDEDDTQ